MLNRIYIIFTLLFLVIACKSEKKTDIKTASQRIVEHNHLTDEEKAEGWTLLFDGKTMAGWHLYNYPDTTSVWKVVNGELYCNSKEGTGQHGDLVTDKEFENYELSFEWKLSESGNSGIFINVQERPDKPATWHTGPEYQLLDPSHMDYAIETKRSGCLYGFSPQLNAVETNPAGQWNTSTIKHIDGKIEFYLNGNLTAQADFTTDAWKERVAASSFKVFPEFGLATKGHIGLQDWFSDVWFRNIKIKTL